MSRHRFHPREDFEDPLFPEDQYDEGIGLPLAEFRTIYAPDGSFIGYAGGPTGVPGHVGIPDEDQVAPRGYCPYCSSRLVYFP